MYVADVAESVAFFERAFGLTTRFAQLPNDGEIDAGGATLSFASYDVAGYHLPEGYAAAAPPPKQMSFEIALVSESVKTTSSAR